MILQPLHLNWGGHTRPPCTVVLWVVLHVSWAVLSSFVEITLAAALSVSSLDEPSSHSSQFPPKVFPALIHLNLHFSSKTWVSGFHLCPSHSCMNTPPTQPHPPTPHPVRGTPSPLGDPVPCCAGRKSGMALSSLASLPGTHCISPLLSSELSESEEATKAWLEASQYLDYGAAWVTCPQSRAHSLSPKLGFSPSNPGKKPSLLKG